MATMMDDIQYLKGVGQKRALLFQKLGIDTVGALLRFYPRSYEDWSRITAIAEARGRGEICVRATVTTPVKEHFIRKNMVLYKFTVADRSGSMQVTLFNSKYEAQKIHAGCEYLFYGKCNPDSFYAEMSAPQIRPVQAAGIRPLYPATAGLSSKMIESAVKTALTGVVIRENLPDAVVRDNGLCALTDAIRNIHFPKDADALEAARKRLVFEELFLLQTTLLLIKKVNRGRSSSVMKTDHTDEFINTLPFAMTGAQRRCVKECVKDMACTRPMNRLLQGDVGSGKTAVGAALCYHAVKNGFQAALMAPTEILAEQHFATFQSFLEKTGIRCRLLTGRMTKKQKEAARQSIEAGDTDIVIGTHALLSDEVRFNKLGLVITDEQHRFGVEQRASLSAKGDSPHILVMSATPIPRTLALILYGDLDISIIDEYPKGRQAIETYAVASALRERVWKYIKKHLDEGRQGYIVCPLVEESEEGTNLTSAEEYYEQLKSGPFSAYRLGLLHGKMKPREKEEVMRAFAEGQIDLLIATTVIEVGIDVPNAAILVVENAERFGLSQLHQLRGRVGRGPFPSTCIFISDGGEKAQSRLKIICSTMDGFKIADEDLALRGPGDFIGSRQHGLPELRIADIGSDVAVLRAAGQQAKKLLQDDPTLRKEENTAFGEEIGRLLAKMQKV